MPSECFGQLLPFTVCLIRVCDSTDYRRDQQLQSAIRSLSVQQSVDLAAYLKGNTEHLSIGVRAELVSRLEEAVLAIPDKSEPITANLDVLTTVRTSIWQRV